ncbi:MAG: glycosyltransferase, partial [Alphaproteobacteria bacterium]
MSIEGAKVYFPVESLTGLGHLNRTGKIVREMVKAGLEVTVASGSFVDPQRFFAGADLKSIP